MHDKPDTMTRRHVLGLVAAGVVGAAAAPLGLFATASSAAGTRRLGVQLYTVRDQIARDAAATLKAIAEIGYRELEILQPTLETILPIARSLELSPVAVHVDPALVLDGGTPAADKGFADLVATASAGGVRHLVLAWIPQARRPDSAAGYRALGDSLNRAGERASRAGLQLAYHNHAFEFQEFDRNRRALDLIVEATDAALVKLELDVFWVAVTGADPVALIRAHAGRIALMHLKDKAKNVGPSLREDQVPRTAFTEAGAGTLDFRAIFAAADAAGVQHYFVEQDHTPGDPLASLRKSYQYLASL